MLHNATIPYNYTVSYYAPTLLVHTLIFYIKYLNFTPMKENEPFLKPYMVRSKQDQSCKITRAVQN